MLAGKWYIAKEMAAKEERLTLTVKYGPFESEREAQEKMQALEAAEWITHGWWAIIQRGREYN